MATLTTFYSHHDKPTTLRVCVFPTCTSARGGDFVQRVHDLIVGELPVTQSIEVGVDGIFAVLCVKKGADLDAIHEAAERVSAQLATHR